MRSITAMTRYLTQAILLFSTVASFAAEPNSGELLFVRRVWPLLQARCLACHGQDESSIKGGYDLRSAAGAVRGGESGTAAIVARQPEQSPLYVAITRSEPDAWPPMPPKEADRLRPDELAWVKEWIALGAPWLDEPQRQSIARQFADRWSAEDGVVIKTSGGTSPEWTERKYKLDSLWAYQPVRKPSTQQTGPGAIDELLARQLPPGVVVAGPASPRVLIRRVTFSLTGLPPTPAEITAFETACAQDAELAWRQLIDRLLDSPHYGERLAQHWLDVVRYADSAGLANDYERGNAWRYRDYVVRAFNEDKPFDDFVREQIAGDELAPDEPEQLVATGFLRMGPWELTGMEVPKVARQRFLDDVTNSIGETFLAHSLQCARCHDHKFDPIPTGDYYAIQAVFATTQLAERPAPFLASENRAGFDERKYLIQRQSEYTAELSALDEVLLRNAERWFDEQGKDSSAWRTALAAVQAKPTKNPRRGYVDRFSQVRAALTAQNVPESDFPPKLVGFTPEQFGRERVARKGLERLRWELERYEPFALSVYAGRTPEVKSVTAPVRIAADPLHTGELETTSILPGGDPFAPSKRVSPGVLSVLGSFGTPAIPDAISGRRAAFAQWVAHPQNALTTRAIVNRVWLWHFGEPLAGNPNNFGSTGKRPTHPALLDWLAASFVENRWSLKQLQRTILLSAAYRRSCEHPNRTQLVELDPLLASYAVFKPRRLSAEELRDAMLVASGELNRTLGGIPNRPEINAEMALQPRQVMGTFAAAWTPNPRPSERHRRSLYALRLRGLSDPALEVFNAPSPDFSCERREASTVTPQVFALFNSRASYARALAIAHRATQETAASANEEQTLVACFERILGRAPSAGELAACGEHWRRMRELQAREPVASVERPPLSVLREAVEENTGEKFSFRESLYANVDFVPDLQPDDCDARTRALADVCLVLLNSNEFAYVY